MRSDEEEVRGPKPGQLNKALAEKEYAKLATKYTQELERKILVFWGQKTPQASNLAVSGPARCDVGQIM